MFKKIFIVVIAVLWYGSAFAAHPLITDDTGTQGKGKYQLEVNGEYGNEKYGVDGEKNTTKMATTLTYGASENADIILGIPYQYIRTKTSATDTESESTKAEDGISDISIESKWRFFEKNGLSLALKPGITLPTGNRKRGLGTGRAAYSLFFITTKEVEPWAFHFNLGYKRNENRNNERIEIWHVSLASEVEVVKDLKAVANIGMERNPDKTSNIDPAFILGGLIYSISKNFDVDFGIRGGLNKPETDYAILAGIAWRF
ncbi:MAG: transporter [Nitrospirae bacterium]|nr:transporter [Nitrospirota bacterium]MBI3378652.1 transporter [Nitrospirota bacterium]